MTTAELIHCDHPDLTLSFARGTTPYAATPSQKARIAHCLHTRLEFTTPFSFEDVPHATDAEYVMTLYLGPPPQKLLVIVHTGSDLVWVNCQPCTTVVLTNATIKRRIHSSIPMPPTPTRQSLALMIGPVIHSCLATSLILTSAKITSDSSEFGLTLRLELFSYLLPLHSTKFLSNTYVVSTP